MTSIVWRKGSTLRVALKVTEGTVAGSEPVTSAIRKRRFGEAVGPALLSLEASFVAAEGDELDQWIFLGSPAQSVTLPIGDYLFAAALDFDDGPQETDPLVIRVVEGVAS